MKRRKTLVLNAAELATLKRLYLEFGIATDKYPLFPEDLERFVNAWSAITGRADTPTEILHFMITRRKKNQWVRFDGAHRRLPIKSSVHFAVDEWVVIDAVFEDLQIASDNFALDEATAAKFRDEFAKRTGRLLPPSILAAAVITRRKNGNLATLRPKPRADDLGFRDIDRIAE